MSKPEVRDMKKSFVAGILGIVFVSFVVFIAFNAQGGLSSLPLVPKTIVKADFNNTAQLGANDLVRQDGIRIGAVQSVNYVNGKSEVTMRLDTADYPIYKNATAAVWDLNALGAKYVELTPGTPDAGLLGDGVIPVSQTEDSYALFQVLGIFDDRTKSALQSTLREVGGGMIAQGENFHDFLSKSDQLLPDLGTVSSSLASQQANLPALLASANNLTGRLKSSDDEIASLIRQTNTTFEAVNVGNSLDDTLQRAPATLTSAKGALDGLQQPLGDTDVTVHEFEPGAKSLADSEPDLRGVLREGVSPLNKVPDVADKADPALNHLTDTFSDGRSAAPDIARVLKHAGPPLRVVEPYAPEAGEWFVRFASFVSLGSTPGERYAYINANGNLSTVTSGLTRACVAQDSYPKPGQADKDRKGFGLPSGTPCPGGKTPLPLAQAIKAMANYSGGHR